MHNFTIFIRILFALIFIVPIAKGKDNKFVLVIDAGHGGKDPGARGSVINEKQINLSVALKLGQLIEANQSDVKIIYTRKKDVFVELDERANIANRNKADLFISIHTNAVKKGNTVKGTETYTLGLARSDENLEVAMRENSAILLEDDYKQKYEGFDPNSSESYIIFEFMQNKHMEQSIGLASAVQKSFVNINRENRGVRQAGFLVLRKTSMPSILIELGYISNATEERFMKTDAGQTRLATAIYNAFAKYKWEYDRKKGVLSNEGGNQPILVNASMEDISNDSYETRTEVTNNDNYSDNNNSKIDLTQITAPAGSEEYIRQKHALENTIKNSQKNNEIRTSSTTTLNRSSVSNNKTIYKVQILSSVKKLPSNSKLFKGYKNVDFFIERGVYMYTYGESNSFEEIKKLRRTVLPHFKDAFIVAFKNGKRIKY